jgi:hypothetical protein
MSSNPDPEDVGSSFPGSCKRKPSLASTFFFVFLWISDLRKMYLLAFPPLFHSVVHGCAPTVPIRHQIARRRVPRHFQACHASQGGYTACCTLNVLVYSVVSTDVHHPAREFPVFLLYIALFSVEFTGWDDLQRIHQHLNSRMGAKLGRARSSLPGPESKRSAHASRSHDEAFAPGGANDSRSFRGFET